MGSHNCCLSVSITLIKWIVSFIFKGDSGGPLICQFNGRDYLFGIHSGSHGEPKEKWSFIFSKCQREATVFVSVSYYRDWIEETSILLGEVWFYQNTSDTPSLSEK